MIGEKEIFIKLEEKICRDMESVDDWHKFEHNYYLVVTPEIYRIIDNHSDDFCGRNERGGKKHSFYDYPLFIADKELYDYFGNKEFYGFIPFKRWNGNKIIDSNDFKNIHKYKKIVWLEELTRQIKKEKLKDLEILQEVKEIEIQNKIIEKFGEF